MKNRKIFVFVFLTIIIFSVNIYANSIKDLKQKQDNLNNEKIIADKNLEDIITQKIIAKTDLDNIDNELLEATDELFKVEQLLFTTTTLLEKTEIELIDAKNAQDIQYELFKDRIRVMYEHKDTGYINVILESKNFSELLDRIEYINRIIEYDNNLVEELTEYEKLIEKKVNEIVKQKEEIEVLHVEQEIKKSNLEVKQEEKRIFIEALEGDELKYQQQIEELENSNKEIEQLIIKAEAEAAAAAARRRAESLNNNNNQQTFEEIVVYTGGEINWPVPGKTKISSGYGNRTNPISKKSEFHTGIDIPAPSGTNIVAAEGGTVVSAGWQNGYGYTVVISHGNGLSTLYAHNSKLVVSKNDVVERGQIISKAGSTGYSTGSHLHFEVRLNGSHQNPNDYF